MVKINYNAIIIERARQGLSIAELARKSNVKDQTITKIEKGKDVRLTSVAKIAKGLGKDIENFIAKENDY